MGLHPLGTGFPRPAVAFTPRFPAEMPFPCVQTRWSSHPGDSEDPVCAFGALGSAPKDVDGSEARPRFVEPGGRGRVDVCRDGDGCVSVAEDDSTGMTAFGFVSGGCRGVCAASTGRRPGAGSGFFVVVVRIFFASF